MSANYRVSFMRAGGWSRLGLAGAVSVLFATPMLWALGAFGSGDDAIHRAVAFALSGLWFFVATGYVVGWALKGFVVRLKEPDEDADERRPPVTAPAPHPPSARPGGR
jgi:hypothetical protein